MCTVYVYNRHMDTTLPNTEPSARRRAVSLTLRPDLMAQARALKLNVSRAAELGIEAAVKDALGKAWLAENADAILAHNERIARSGTLITPPWLKR